ncbi:MAG: OmpA family protein [Massilia sp.]
MHAMKSRFTLTAVSAALALLAAPLAQAQATADQVFINPDWANSAVYIGAGVGQSRATIDQQRISRSLSANGATVTGFNTDERDVGYRLFVGKQLNTWLAVEAGYFDLGKFGFQSTTDQGGVLNGEVGFRGVNLDLVGQLPLSQRFSLLGRAGVQYAKTSAHISGNRLVTAANANPSENKSGARFGVGLEYKLSEALALRAEAERNRVHDAVGNRGDADMVSLSLVYKLGRPAARVPVAMVQAAPEPVAAMPAPAPAEPTPAPAPLPVSEKVALAAEALFDFDKAVLKPEGKRALDGLFDQVQGMNTEVMVTVGHTDAVGSDRYNQALSQRRADAVKAYLVQKGLEPARLFSEGKGETMPVADNRSAAGRAKNRRVTIEVVGTRSTAR